MPVLELTQDVKNKTPEKVQERILEELSEELLGKGMDKERWDMLEKDFKFYTKANISLDILEQYWDTIDPVSKECLSMNMEVELTPEFIRKHHDELDVTSLTYRGKDYTGVGVAVLSEEIFEEFGYELDWAYLAHHPLLVPDKAKEKYAKLMEFGAKENMPESVVQAMTYLMAANEEIMKNGATQKVQDLLQKKDDVLQEYGETFKFDFNDAFNVADLQNRWQELYEEAMSSNLTEEERRFNLLDITQEFFAQVADIGRYLVDKFKNIPVITSIVENTMQNIRNIYENEVKIERSNSRASEGTAGTSKENQTSETPEKQTIKDFIVNNLNKAKENPEQNLKFLGNFSYLVDWKNMKNMSIFATYFVKGREHLINWNAMSKEVLPMKFILEYKDQEGFDVMEALTNNDYSKRDCDRFDWNSVELSKIDNGIFIRKYGERLDLTEFNWEQLNNIDDIGTDWFRDNADYINAKNLANYSNISEDMIEVLSTSPDFAKNFDYVEYFDNHNVSEDFIDKYADYIDWEYLSGSHKINREMLKKYDGYLNIATVINSANDITTLDRQELESRWNTIVTARDIFRSERNTYTNINNYDAVIESAFLTGINVTEFLDKSVAYTPNQVNVIVDALRMNLPATQVEVIAKFVTINNIGDTLLEAAINGINIEKLDIKKEFTADRVRETIAMNQGTFSFEPVPEEADPRIYTSLYEDGASMGQARFVAVNYNELKFLGREYKNYSPEQLEQYVIAHQSGKVDLNKLMHSDFTVPKMKLFITLEERNLLNADERIDFINNLPERKLHALVDSIDEGKFRANYLEKDVRPTTIEAVLGKRSYVKTLFEKIASGISKANLMGAALVKGIIDAFKEQDEKNKEAENKTKDYTQPINETNKTQETATNAPVETKQNEPVSETTDHTVEPDVSTDDIYTSTNEATNSLETDTDQTTKTSDTQDYEQPLYTSSDDIIEEVSKNQPVDDILQDEELLDDDNIQSETNDEPVIPKEDHIIDDDLNDALYQTQENNEIFNTPKDEVIVDDVVVVDSLQAATAAVRSTIISNDDFRQMYEDGTLQARLEGDVEQLKMVQRYLQSDSAIKNSANLKTLNELIKTKQNQISQIKEIRKLNPTLQEEQDFDDINVVDDIEALVEEEDLDLNDFRKNVKETVEKILGRDMEINNINITNDGKLFVNFTDHSFLQVSPNKKYPNKPNLVLVDKTENKDVLKTDDVKVDKINKSELGKIVNKEFRNLDKLKDLLKEERGPILEQFKDGVEKAVGDILKRDVKIVSIDVNEKGEMNIAFDGNLNLSVKHNEKGGKPYLKLQNGTSNRAKNLLDSKNGDFKIVGDSINNYFVNDIEQLKEELAAEAIEAEKNDEPIQDEEDKIENTNQNLENKEEQIVEEQSVGDDISSIEFVEQDEVDVQEEFAEDINDTFDDKDTLDEEIELGDNDNQILDMIEEEEESVCIKISTAETEVGELEVIIEIDDLVAEIDPESQEIIRINDIDVYDASPDDIAIVEEYLQADGMDKEIAKVLNEYEASRIDIDEQDIFENVSEEYEDEQVLHASSIDIEDNLNFDANNLENDVVSEFGDDFVVENLAEENNISSKDDENIIMEQTEESKIESEELISDVELKECVLISKEENSFTLASGEIAVEFNNDGQIITAYNISTNALVESFNYGVFEKMVEAIKQDIEKENEELKENLAKVENMKENAEKVEEKVAKSEPTNEIIAESTMDKQPEKITEQSKSKNAFVPKRSVVKKLIDIDFVNTSGNTQKLSEFKSMLERKCTNPTVEQIKTDNHRSDHGIFKFDRPEISITGDVIKISGHLANKKGNHVFVFDSKTNEFISATVPNSKGKAITYPNKDAFVPKDFADAIKHFTNFLDVHEIEKDMLVSVNLQAELLENLSKIEPQAFDGILKDEGFEIKVEMNGSTPELAIRGNGIEIISNNNEHVINGINPLNEDLRTELDTFMKNNNELLFKGIIEIEGERSNNIISQEAQQLVTDAQTATIEATIDEVRNISSKLAENAIENFKNANKNWNFNFYKYSRDVSNVFTGFEKEFDKLLNNELKKVGLDKFIIKLADEKLAAVVPSFKITIPKKLKDPKEVEVHGACEIKIMNNAPSSKKVLDMLKFSDFDITFARDDVEPKEGNKENNLPRIFNEISKDDIIELSKEYSKGISQEENAKNAIEKSKEIDTPIRDNNAR